VERKKYPHAASIRVEVSTTSGKQDQRGSVLVVDDDPQFRELIAGILERGGYRAEVTGNLTEAQRRLSADDIELCLCDLHLGGTSGLELAAQLAAAGPRVAVVMVSGSDDPSLAEEALRLGAYDYLLKPFRHTELLITVANAFHRLRLEQESARLRGELEQTVAQRTVELALSREETIHRLARAVEFRDSHTGLHVERMAAYCRMIALQLGLPPDRCSLIRTASLLHDIGKLGIPDRILVKPGPLTEDERAEIQEHTTLGHRILRGSASGLIRLAAEIALNHHERYDGAGYPRGLSRDEIPLEGRIAAVCDVFDALTTPRPYRPRPYTQPEAAAILRDERGKAFDPEVVDAFLGALDEVERIRARYADANGHGAKTAA
jgi:putative two-component system response regulator